MSPFQIALLALLAAGIAYCSLCFIWCGYMLRRNDWVYRNRCRLIAAWYSSADRNGQWDDEWLSYDEMMARFWVWDINKLRKVQP